MFPDKKSRGADLPLAILLFLGAFCVFASGSSRLGFYYDDAGFLLGLPPVHSLQGLWIAIQGYVPGRNLHILWQYVFFLMVGGNPVAHLPALHRIQAGVDSLVVVLFFFLLRKLKLSLSASLTAAGLFAFWPPHGETHFWMSSLPMNIMSTLFVLVFALTSVLLAEGRRSRWLWTVDVASFWCAVLTYDQPLLAMLLIAGARLVWVFWRRRAAWPAFLAMHTIHAMAAAVFVWLALRGRAAGGGGPIASFGPDLWNHLREMIRACLWANSQNVSDEFRAADAAGGNRLLAFGVAILFVAAAVWFCKTRPRSSHATHLGRLLLFGLAVAFWFAAYLPVWLWYPSPRHHYLPTVGLFCAGAVVLDWLEWADARRIVSPLVHLGLGAVVGLGAAATLLEGHYWQESFQAKNAMFQEIRPQMAGKRALVLDGFPIRDGPAIFIAPLDAFFGPALLLPDLALPAGYQGSMTAVRTDGGIVLGTQAAPGSPVLPEDAVLWIRFQSFQNGVLQYTVVAPPQ